MAWFKRDKKAIEQATPPEERKVRTEGLWVKCESCGTIVFRKDLEANLLVCPKCGFHFKMNSKQRLEMLLDGRYTEHDAGMTSTDRFNSSTRSLTPLAQGARRKLGMNDAVIRRRAACWAPRGLLCDGIQLHRRLDGRGRRRKSHAWRQLAMDTRQPLIVISCSGGARMMEGTISLMQLAKVSAALARLDDAKVPYISVLTDPTTGGVTASSPCLAT